MKVIDFCVRNYRSCRITKLTPHQGLTALIGVNGSGKSNLLSALLLLKRSTLGTMRYHAPIDHRYLNRSRIEATVEYHDHPIRLRGEVLYYTSDRNTDDVVATRLKWNLENITGRSAWLELPIEMLTHRGDYPFVISHSGRRLSYEEMVRGRWYGPRGMRSLLPEKVFPVAQEIAEYFANINYYSASQFADPSRCPVSLDLEDDRPALRRRRDAINHEQFMYDLYASFKKKGDTYTRFKNVVGPEGIGLVDDIKFDEISLPSNVIEVRTGGRTEKKERTKIVVVPTFTIDQNVLSPNQLSEGTFKTLALLFYVLTDDSKLLLVEEPEVCIHHGLLNSIIALIKDESKDKQIIISTHSDYVLDQLRPENVVLVERDRHRGTKARPVNKALSKTDFKALKQYLEQSGNLGEYWREGGLKDE